MFCHRAAKLPGLVAAQWRKAAVAASPSRAGVPGLWSAECAFFQPGSLAVYRALLPQPSSGWWSRIICWRFCRSGYGMGVLLKTAGALVIRSASSLYTLILDMFGSFHVILPALGSLGDFSLHFPSPKAGGMNADSPRSRGVWHLVFSGLTPFTNLGA